MEEGAEAELTRLLDKLAELRALDPELLQFGALDHRYELHPVLSEQDLAGFEREHGVTLPHEYRIFLRRAGNGGAGPAYGLSQLAAWRPELRLVTKYVEFADGVPVMVNGKPVIVEIEPRPHIDRPAEPSRPFVLDGAWPKRGEVTLPGGGAHPFDGCTHLAEMGDGYRYFLVVTGRRAGEVWEDHTHGVAFDAIRPTGCTFLVWYERWLDDAIQAARQQR